MAPRQPRSATLPDSAASWELVRGFMRRVAGVLLAEDQRYLLQARLGPVAKAEGYDSVAGLVQRACRGPANSRAARDVLDALTTHETYFFRDRSFWRSLEEDVIPRLLQRGSRPLRIWAAACSTGQEPYSLAMLLDELWPEIAPRCEILATDISDKVLESAARGIYTTFEVNRGLTARRLVRHFSQAAGGFRVRDPLRSRVRWSSHNLLKEWTGRESFDLVLCRNVLIYFSKEDRVTVQRHLVGKLAPGGFLGLGCAEIATRGLLPQPLAPGWYEVNKQAKAA